MNKNKIALMVNCNPSSGLARECKGVSFTSNEHYNTGSSDAVKQSAETKALHLLREAGFDTLQQLDWVGKKDGKWVIFEIKEKCLFSPGNNYPHWAAGLNKGQLYLRSRLFKELGLRTYLINFVPGTDEVYGAYLDDLEAKREFYDTPHQDIRVYPIKNYSKGIEAIRRDLNGR
jgi:hypothetical protein